MIKSLAPGIDLCETPPRPASKMLILDEEVFLDAVLQFTRQQMPHLEIPVDADVTFDSGVRRVGISWEVKNV